MINQKDIKFLNTYLPNKSFKIHEAKTDENARDINKSLIRDFNSPISIISREKICKDIDLYHTINHLDLIDIYSTNLPRTAEYTFLKNVHEVYDYLITMLIPETNIR